MLVRAIGLAAVTLAASCQGASSSSERAPDEPVASAHAIAPIAADPGGPSASARAPVAPLAPPTPPARSLTCEDLVPPGAKPAALPALPPERRLRGVDVSSLAPWKAIREAGFGFAFAGATHGLARNASFAPNWAMMRRCGLPRGAYHFLTEKSDGPQQARAFLEQLADDPGELPPVVDIERPDCAGACCGLSCGAWIRLASSFVDAVERVVGKKPIVYAVEPFWNQCLCGTTRFAADALWLAGWPRFDFPERVRSGGWDRWTFYQHAGNVRLGGGVVDLDLFRGTADDLARFVAGTSLPP